MALGPGKYDDLCTYVREKSGGLGAVVIILDGNMGQGFSVQMPEELMWTVPHALRKVIAAMEEAQRRN